MIGLSKAVASSLLFGLFAVAPSSTNFTLKTYDFGSGGGNQSSTNYDLNAETGEQSGEQMSSSNFGVGGGTQNTQNSNVPPAPTFTNPSSEYDRLQIIINTGGNPSDTRYQIAISSDSFASTFYVQTDNTVGTTNTVTQYQTYTSYGGASGTWIVGLDSNTAYEVKVRALQGDFTGSAFGPTASASTVSSSLSFSVETSLSAVPPYTVGFSSLAAGVVSDGDASAEIGIATNSLNGGQVYIKSNGILSSALGATSIPSATANLTSAPSGYGVIVASTSQSSGGPLAAVSPFNGASNNVGALTTAFQSIITTSTSVTAGTASVTLKAKVDSITPSATDYTDTLTFVAAMLY